MKIEKKYPFFGGSDKATYNFLPSISMPLLLHAAKASFGLAKST